MDTALLAQSLRLPQAPPHGGQLILSAYSIPELAKLEATIAGILGGASLTVAVLVMERLMSPRSGLPTRFDEPQAKAATLTFITGFVISLAAAFSFAVLAGEEATDLKTQIRLAAVLLFAAFVLTQCFVYLFLGLTGLLFSADLASEAEWWVGVVLIFALAAVGSHLAFSSIWSVAIMQNMTFGQYAGAHAPLYVACMVTALTPVVVGFSRVTGPRWSKWFRDGSWSRRTFPRSRVIRWLSHAFSWIAAILSDPEDWRLGWQRRLYPYALCLALVVTFAASAFATFIVDEVPGFIRFHAGRIAFALCATHAVVTILSTLLLPRRQAQHSER